MVSVVREKVKRIKELCQSAINLDGEDAIVILKLERREKTPKKGRMQMRLMARGGPVGVVIGHQKPSPDTVEYICRFKARAVMKYVEEITTYVLFS